MLHRRLAHFDVECGAARDHVAPDVLTEAADGEHSGFVERLSLHLDSVTDAGHALETDGADAQRHSREIIKFAFLSPDTPSVPRLDTLPSARSPKKSRIFEQ